MELCGTGKSHHIGRSLIVEPGPGGDQNCKCAISDSAKCIPNELPWGDAILRVSGLTLENV